MKKDEHAILRGLAAEYGRSPSSPSRGSRVDDAVRPRRPSARFSPSPIDSIETFSDIDLPPLQTEADPEPNVSSTSTYSPPDRGVSYPTLSDASRAERKYAQLTIDHVSHAPPPITTRPEPGSIGRPAPRLDRRGDRDDVIEPPRMNIRRHIPRVGKNSEFIFGTSVVQAAIKSHRRTLYRLYIYAGENRTQEVILRDARMKKLAKEHHPDLEIVDEADLGQLNSMSDSRPHK